MHAMESRKLETNLRPVSTPWIGIINNILEGLCSNVSAEKLFYRDGIIQYLVQKFLQEIFNKIYGKAHPFHISNQGSIPGVRADGKGLGWMCGWLDVWVLTFKKKKSTILRTLKSKGRDQICKFSHIKYAVSPLFLHNCTQNKFKIQRVWKDVPGKSTPWILHPMESINVSKHAIKHQSWHTGRLKYKTKCDKIF